MSKYADLSLGRIEAIVNKLGGMKGVEKFLRGETEVTINTFVNPYLRMLPRTRMVIPATDGQRTINAASSYGKEVSSDGGNTVFEASELDHAFKYRLVKPDVPKPETAVKLLKRYGTNEAPLYEIFASLNKPFEELCFTQHQIVSFCDTYRDELTGEPDDPGILHFLLKDEGGKHEDEFIVAKVARFYGGDRYGVKKASESMPFKPNYKGYYGEYYMRLVVPAVAVV